jgi:hypothetical protein
MCKKLETQHNPLSHPVFSIDYGTVSPLRQMEILTIVVKVNGSKDINLMLEVFRKQSDEAYGGGGEQGRAFLWPCWSLLAFPHSKIIPRCNLCGQHL